MEDDKVMTNAIKDFADYKTMHEIMTGLLQHVISITCCDYGLIAETKYTEEGSPYSRFRVVHGFPDDSPYMFRLKRDNYVDFMQPGTLNDKVYETRKPVICNDIIVHRRGAPMPDGHPPMMNFALFPLWLHDKIIGVVGLSGKDVNMTEEWATTIQTRLRPVESMMILLLERQTIELHRINFLDNISHELRTPINGIISMTKMLGETSLDSEQTELLDIITHCNVQLLEIINDIADYTKISTGKLRFNNKPFSLKKCVTEIVQAISPKAKRTTKLLLDYNTDADLIISDEVRITQILLNLLNNSIQFTKKGTIHIVIETVSATTEHTTLKFKVKDTGIGIPASKIKYIFNSLNQITNLASGRGVGLGLPITKYLVNAFNGTISAESEENVGTTIEFTLRLNNFIGAHSEKELIEYFKHRYILVVSNNPDEKEIILQWAVKLSIMPIICGMSEMHMYLSNKIFTFAAIILSIGDSILEIDLMQTELVKHSCPKAILCSATVMDKYSELQAIDYVYSKSDIVPTLSLFINRVYAMETIKSKRGTESVAPMTRGGGAAAASLNYDEIKKNINILVAEDNLENQKVISKLLNSLGYYNITITSDGLEFFMEAQKNPYDIAFVDLKMQVMDGLTAVKKFKEKSSQNIIIVAVTATMSESIRKDCYNAGMDGYITKPIDYNELKSALNATIRKKISSV
jgi:signal transduction histidine kinase/CheY-like chemotaxis protein